MSLLTDLVSSYAFSDSLEDEHGSSDLLGSAYGYTTGLMGRALQVDNAAALTAVPRLGAPWVASGSFSVELWVYPQSSNFSPYTTIWAQSSDTLSRQRIQLTPVINRVEASTGTGGGLSAIISPAIVGRWVHIVLTYDAAATAQKLYVDGELVASDTAGAFFDDVNRASVGGLHLAGSDTAFHQALIDTCRMWSRALTATEVTDLRANGSGWAYPFLAQFPSAPTAQTWLHTPQHIVQQLLIDEGLATDPAWWQNKRPGDDTGGAHDWAVFRNKMPDAPDNCILVKRTGDRLDARILSTGQNVKHYGIMLQVRGGLDDGAALKQMALETALTEQLYDKTVTIDGTDYYVQSFPQVTSTPSYDDVASTRRLYSINCLAVIQPYPLRG